MTRVLVVDDHPVVLAGLTAMIDATDDLEVVGSATTVEGAMGLSVDLAPTPACWTSSSPDGDGIALGIAAKKRWPGTRVLLLTMSADPAAVMRSLSADLDGYVLKDADPSELFSAIRSAAAGAVVLGRAASCSTISAVAAGLPAIGPSGAWTPEIARSSTCSFGVGTPARSPGSSSSPQRPSGTASRTSSASSASQLARKQSSWAAPAGLDANAAP